ncbi:hypothetical protein MSG28_003094 [Choristoneura fumiferana]|uniref:Uncharacterized protein n=1 Tax=Choristoneura fumiferana TaxID=7141 RepID=A0ACC0KDD0_CHOFU|nr:hypothetical protein MSG28_003094 [Choristoneura fumiferana]
MPRLYGVGDGTTWTQDLVWLLMNNFDFETALKIPLMGRYFFIEITSLAPMDKLGPDQLDPVMLQEFAKLAPSFQAIVDAPSPRFIKSHLPLSLLPDNLLDTAKVVYVARDPRDVAVSFYHHSRLFKTSNYVGDFKSFWDLFVKDLVTYTPFFPHLKEAWAQRHHPNMLFIFYEDLKKDLPGHIKRIAEFLGKEVTSEQTQKLCEHLDIKNFRNNESVNPTWLNATGNAGEEGFIRQGKTGGWYDYFDEAMAAQAQAWIRVNLAGTDLRFPNASSKVATLVSKYNKG